MAEAAAKSKEEVNVEEEVVEEEVVEPLSDEERLVEANNFIRRRMFWSAGVGLIALPVVDLVALLALQIDMVRVLAKYYDVPFKRDVVKSIISGLLGSIVPVGLAGPVAYVVKNIPLVGLPLGVLSMSILGGASTYAVGKVFIAHFEAGGTLLNFDPEAMNEHFKEKFAEGKEIVSEMKKKKK